MNIIAWIVLGAIAGYLAGFLVKGDEGLVVELPDLLHSLHERREGLELGPLVVRGPDGDVDVDRFHDLRHVKLLMRWLGIGTPTWCGGRSVGLWSRSAGSAGVAVRSRRDPFGSVR